MLQRPSRQRLSSNAVCNWNTDEDIFVITERIGDSA
jgi:hypothetical protein